MKTNNFCVSRISLNVLLLFSLVVRTVNACSAILENQEVDGVPQNMVSHPIIRGLKIESKIMQLNVSLLMLDSNVCNFDDFFYFYVLLVK